MLKKFFTSSIFPFWFFHIPILPYYLYLSLRRWNLAFFTNTNPNIYMGGFINSSKIDAFKGIDQSFLPKSVYFPEHTSYDLVLEKLNQLKLSFPIILKPDKGERGLGVIKINSRDELKMALGKTYSDFMLQEFIDYPLEFGILYYKYPKSKKENISSICSKELPFVTGNGKESIKELVERKYKTQNFENLNSENKSIVLKKEEDFFLEYIAHRNRQCTFRDFNHIHCQKLVDTFSAIASKMDGFNFGRFDIRTKSIHDLINGDNIKILEVNGVNSQPIHIFDPSHSFFKCYKDLHTHWHLIYKISKQNSKLGYAPISGMSLIKEIIKKYKK